LESHGPGKLVLFGSGEATNTGRRIHAEIMRSLGGKVKVAILETPAGFQPNSELVARKLADFFRIRLAEHVSDVWIVPARRQDGEASTNSPSILSPLIRANYLFMGPGSPTYTVKHMAGSLAYRTIAARHRQGAVLCLASAATIAFGRHCLPVYEIFKVGDDLHWKDGLDFLGRYGLSVSFVTHWNNQEGGEELDTSCCFMGRDRMTKLLAMLPVNETVIAIDEHTALVIDLDQGQCWVRGIGKVYLIRSAEVTLIAGAYETFPIDVIGQLTIPNEAELALPEVNWPAASLGYEGLDQGAIERILRERAAARKQKNWTQADALRQQLQDLGIEVRDTPEGTLWRSSHKADTEWRLLSDSSP
jgi:cyanophycinase-like exopeptidase